MNRQAQDTQVEVSCRQKKSRRKHQPFFLVIPLFPVNCLPPPLSLTLSSPFLSRARSCVCAYMRVLICGDVRVPVSFVLLVLLGFLLLVFFSGLFLIPSQAISPSAAGSKRAMLYSKRSLKFLCAIFCP